MNELLLFGMAMVLPGAVLALAVDTARVLWARRKARRQECRRPQGRLEREVGHA